MPANADLTTAVNSPKHSVKLWALYRANTDNKKDGSPVLCVLQRMFLWTSAFYSLNLFLYFTGETQAYFANEREKYSKSTVISTNLSLEELNNAYSDRVFSRMFSNFEFCPLTGQDVRIYLKQMQTRK